MREIQRHFLSILKGNTENINGRQHSPNSNKTVNPMITTKLHTALKLPKPRSLPSLPTLLKTGFTPTLRDFNRFLLFLSRTNRFSAIIHFLSQMHSNKLRGNSQTQAILTTALIRDEKFEEAALFAKTKIVKTPNCSHRSQILDPLIQGLCITEPEMALSALRDCLRIDGIVPSSYTLCSLLYRLCSFGMMDGATQVLEWMSDERISYPFDNFVCSCVISAFVSVGKPELALRFYSNAVKLGSLKPNVITCTSVMSAYCRLGRVNEVYSLVDMMGREALDAVFYSNWICGYFSDGMIQDALERYREMVEGSIELDTVSYTILIDGFSKEGIVEKAVGFLYKMRKDGIEPNLVTYTAIMQGFCKKGKLEEAFSVFKMVEDLGTEMDEFPYVILIDGVCRKGDYHHALKLLNGMEKKGVKPSVITYNAIINGLCKAGRTAEADDVSKGIVGDVITYSTLLHGYIQEKNVMGILETRRRLEAADVCLDVAMCNLLIKGLFMMGLFEDVHSIYKRMQEIGLEADVVTYYTMINGYSKANQIDVALEIFDQFRKKSISSAACHNCIIQWLCRKGMVEMAVEVFLELIERDFGLNPAIYRMVIKSVFQDNGAKGVLSLIQRLENVVNEIFDPICNIAICFLCKNDGFEAACNVLIKLERKGSTVNSKSYYLILKALLREGESLLSWQILTTFIKKYGMYDPRVNKMLATFLCLNDVNLALSFLAKGSLNNVSFSAAVLKTLTKNGQVWDAYRLITEAGNSLPVMDVADYSIVIDGLCKGGQIGWALNLCDFAMNKGVTLSVITYNSVINGLCRQGFLLEAFRLFDSLEKTGIYPSEITYGTLIDTLLKEGLLQDSMMLFEKMLRKNIPLNIHVYNSLINVYTKLGDVQKAMELLHDVEAKGLKPDEFTVSTLINGYCQKGDMEGALVLFAEFKGKSISPDFLGFMYLIRGLCAKGRMEESRCILREMLQSQPVTRMLDRVETETKAESLKDFVSLLCEQGSIHDAVSILNEVGCMYFPVERGYSAFNISEKLKEPCDREAVDAVECKITVSESKSCNVEQLEMDLENDTDLDANIFHLENFGSFYSLIALYCSKGELNKANILAKKIMS